MKAVIVEDEILIREGLCKLMEKMFPEISIAGVASNGEEGLLCVEEHKPELVVTDIKMPVMDGLEMLSIMQERGMSPKVIVLTAYSEFAYAQQAVKLGVCDYIIKPIVVQEFMTTIRKIQNLCEQEQKRTPDTMGNLEHVVSGILHGEPVLDEQMESFLYKKYGMSKDSPMMELLIYMGEYFEEGKERKRLEMGRLLTQRDIRHCMVDMEYDKVILVLIYGYTSRKEIERWYQNQILLQKREARERKISYGMVEVNGVENIRGGYQTLLPYMDWNLVLGDDILISYPKIADVQTEICVYPVELENQMKIAVCAGENGKIRNIMERFHDYFLKGKVYSPKDVKNSYVRFQWSLLNVAKEVGCINYEEVDQKSLLNHVMGAKTGEELKNACESLVCRLSVSADKAGGKAGAVSLAVKRAQSMIHEFYADGITLCEIADKLNMTQEYLGTQFHKELGENFSTYMRNFRISKAKELLIGTQLKQYEISEKVGYTDAKYFARVFKECVGMSPAEYRKFNR